MEEKRLEYLTMLQIHGSDTLVLTQLLTDLPPLQHRHLHNPPILKPYKENQKRFIIHAEHVVHRRGYCFDFGCMFVCMYVC